METTQIYQIVNEINEQSAGKVGITAVDTASFVSLGDAILSSQSNTEGFLNSLCQYIYRDIIEGRAYKSSLRTIMFTNEEYGAILRKISVDMPDLVEEKGLPLIDGQSVDQWEVKKPKVNQWLFASRTPYSAWVTIQRTWLREAFRSESDMESFIQMVFLKIQNRLEISVENMGKAAHNNYAGIMAQAGKTIDLVSMYNAETGGTLGVGLAALHDKDFLNYSTGVIKETAIAFTTMSTLFNYAEEERFTPFSDQRLLLLSKFETQLETVSLYGAFHDDYLKTVTYIPITAWQGTGTKALDFSNNSKISVKVKTLDDDTETPVEINNVVGMLMDKFAVGANRFLSDVLSTPLNARGLYYNTFFHEQQAWMNQLDENFVIFTLN